MRASTDRVVLARLAGELGLPLYEVPPADADLALCLEAARLVLVDLREPKRRPVAADFTDAGSRHGRDARVPALVRAVGRGAAHVVDATAGLGRDAATLAAHCTHLTLVEREPVLWAVLRDGLARALEDPSGHAQAAHIALVRADAREWLAALREEERPDVVFLDPMFPDRKKGLSKREMQMLQHLVGPPHDAHELLEVARAVARRRVVVKRSPRTPPLAPDPHHALETKLVRFDVYESGKGNGNGKGQG